MIKTLLLLASLLVPTSSADVKISELPLHATASSGVDDSFPYVDALANVTFRAKLSDIVNIPTLAAALASKQPAGSFISALTGDVTATGPGSVAAIVAELQGYELDLSTPPTNGQVLKYSTVTSKWTAQSDNGQVTDVTASAPLSSSGGATPNLSITQSGVATDGYLSSTDWNTFNNKVSSSRSISTTSPLAGGGDLSANRTFSISQSGVATDGYLSSTDWNTFNNKQAAGSYALQSTAINTTSPLTGGGDLSTSRTLSIPVATTSVNGYLSSTDWNTFNNKQAAGSYITALTGDVTASGPGSAAATIANLAVTNAKIANSTIDLTAKVTGALPIANAGTNLTTYTTGDMLYASATNVLSKLAAGSVGQIIRYVGGIPTVEDQVNAASQVILYEDWIGDAVGALRWLDADTGTGASTTELTVATSGHPGILELDTVASATNTAARYLGGVTSGAATSGFIVGGGALSFEADVRVEDLSTAAQEYSFWIGLSDTATANANYVGITYQRTINGDFWICKTVSAATATNTDSTIAVAADTWYKLRVEINAAGTSVSCFVNGVAGGVVTTNIPTVTVAPQMRITKSVGTNSRVAYVDYFKFYQRLTSAR